MSYNFKRILVLAPHADDGETSCGGSISKWLEQGKEVYYVAFSSARKSVPPGMPEDILEKEVKEATQVLGIPPGNLILFNYPVREFPTHRQEILEDMVRLRNEINPELVLLPSTSDTHQDHQTISQEGFRAFKKASIIGYEKPYNNLNFHTDLFVVLEEKHVSRRLEALKCYKSQTVRLAQDNRVFPSADFVLGLANVRGTQIGVKYAEAFEVIRWVIK